MAAAYLPIIEICFKNQLPSLTRKMFQNFAIMYRSFIYPEYVQKYYRCYEITYICIWISLNIHLTFIYGIFPITVTRFPKTHDKRWQLIMTKFCTCLSLYLYLHMPWTFPVVHSPGTFHHFHWYPNCLQYCTSTIK